MFYRLLIENEYYCLCGDDKVVFQLVNLYLIWGLEVLVNVLLVNVVGFYDVFGNVWYWCEDDFYFLEGFWVYWIYDDFSIFCFDGEYKMILGGFFISIGDEVIYWVRFYFWFYFFQYVGFWLVCLEDCDVICDVVLIFKSSGVKVYEGEKILVENLMLYYGLVDEIMFYSFGFKDVVGFFQQIVVLILKIGFSLGIEMEWVLDVGCLVGGLIFVLVWEFQLVLGIDFSVIFIEAVEIFCCEG